MPSKTTPKITSKITLKITPKITLIDTPDDGMLKALGEKLMDFNKVSSGRPLDYRSLTIFVTHPDSGELLGGLWGGTSYSHLHIELLYLPEDLRDADLGSRLMAQAEQEAIQRGCLGVWLDTFSFQARGFYERLGYTVFGTFEDYLPATADSSFARPSNQRPPHPDSLLNLQKPQQNRLSSPQST